MLHEVYNEEKRSLTITADGLNLKLVRNSSPKLRRTLNAYFINGRRVDSALFDYALCAMIDHVRNKKAPNPATLNFKGRAMYSIYNFIDSLKA